MTGNLGFVLLKPSKIKVNLLELRPRYGSYGLEVPKAKQSTLFIHEGITRGYDVGQSAKHL